MIMGKEGLMPHSSERNLPTGWLRVALQLPARLYRWRLGWLLGHRFLQLAHRGRSSGRVYRTVIEVVRYDRARRESVVVSAWGDRADWYRNIQATPAEEIQIGRERYRPQQHLLSANELARVLADYERRHPLAIRVLDRAFAVQGQDRQARMQDRVARFRGVTFRPRREPDDGTGAKPSS
jgi:deazaflavin-dependent oxidoreductase (nitroreductase family)